MRCHECGAPAVFTPEHEHVRVGLCRTHMQWYLSTLEQHDSLKSLQERIDATVDG